MIRVTVVRSENVPGLTFDLHRFQATLALKVERAVAEAIRERVDPAFEPLSLSRCDVSVRVDPMNWLGGKLEWDCLLLVERVEAVKPEGAGGR